MGILGHLGLLDVEVTSFAFLARLTWQQPGRRIRLRRSFGGRAFQRRFSRRFSNRFEIMESAAQLTQGVSRDSKKDSKKA